MKRRCAALLGAFAILSACAPQTPRPDDGDESVPLPPFRADESALLTTDCNGNGMMDLFEVQPKRFELRDAAVYDAGHDNDVAVVEDFDGDGDADVAVLQAAANRVAILINDGGGVLSFDPTAAIGLDAAPLRIAVGRINADGRADIAVLYRQDNVEVFLNAGSGRPSFTLAATYTLSDTATMSGSWDNKDLVVADLDADGRAEIAALVTKSFHRQMVLLWNNGDGTFGDPQRERSLRPQGVNSLAGVDVDRNGHADLVIGSQSEGIAIVMNQGARVMTYSSSRDDLHHGVSGYGLRAGDLNEDGYPELLIRQSDGVAILVNASATGAIAFEREPRTLAVADTPNALTAADMDGDGMSDIAVSKGGAVAVYLNQGDLSFERAHDFAPGFYANQLTSAALNSRDPQDLLVTAGAGDHRIAAFINASRVSSDCNLNQRPDACDIRVGRSADCNSNAVPDECDLDNRVDFSVRIFEAPRAQGFMFYDPRLLLLGLDRNTSPDLLVINGWTAEYTRFFLNRSDATFELFRNPAEADALTERHDLRWALLDRGIEFYAQSVVAATAAELTGDGRTDLAVANLAENSINIIRRRVNSRGEEYWPAEGEEVYVAGAVLRHIEAADLDADGDIDLVAAPSGGWGSIVLLRNGGNGDFSHEASWDVSLTETPTSIAMSDLDGDGLPELVFSKYAAGTVTVCKNQSTVERLRFGLCTAFAAGSAPIALKVGDLDADSYPDVVVTNDFGSHVSVLRNIVRKGDDPALGRVGVWQRRLGRPESVRVEGSSRAYPKDVALADFDGDGDLDVAASNWGTHRVSILRNKGNGTFLGPLGFVTGLYPESMRAADLDGDARVDLAVANGNGDVTILLNRSRPALSRDIDSDLRPDECSR